MGQGRRNDAALKDAVMVPSTEEFVAGMGQGRNFASVKDAQTKPNVVEFVKGTGHIAIHTMNLLHLDLSSRRLL